MVITRKIAIQTLRELVNKQHTWAEDIGGEYSRKVEKILIYAADELELLMLKEGSTNETIQEAKAEDIHICRGKGQSA